MIETLLLRGVHAAEEFGDGRGGGLFPEEEEAIADAVPKRRDEFAAVRRCARRALIELGHPPVALVSGPGGAPVWPRDVVGSMTHCGGYRAAVVADRRCLPAIGIDAEPDESLPGDVLTVVARPEEIRRFGGTESVRAVNWDRLLFSAKESVYKAWYPLTQRWLDFDDVSVTPDPHRRRFSARVLVAAPAALRHFRGAWTAADGLLLTASVPACAGVDARPGAPASPWSPP